MCPVRYILGQQRVVGSDQRYIQALGNQRSGKTERVRGRYLHTIIFFSLKNIVEIPEQIYKKRKGSVIRRYPEGAGKKNLLLRRKILQTFFEFDVRPHQTA